MDIIRIIEKTVKKEIKYVSGLYPFDIDKYFDNDFVYARSIFFFSGLLQKQTTGPDAKDNEGIAGLATGIELLGIGLSLHIFDPLKDDDKKYILELLIGDIVYARAIIYLLKHGDFDLFKIILASLKQSHKSRLKIHGLIKKAITEEKDSAFSDIKKIIEDRDLLTDASSLLKTSYEISRELFKGSTKDNEKARDLAGKLGRSIAMRRTIREVNDYLSKSRVPASLMDSIMAATGKLDKSLEDKIRVLWQDIQQS